jgi:23S rRNA (pseudouridine1915-N3)-methyltransferase
VKVSFLTIGKTSEEYLKQGISIYENRLKNYLSFESIVLPEVKKTSNTGIVQQKVLEGQVFLNQLNIVDMVVLLDEKGKELTSVEFCGFLQKQFLQSFKRIVFIIGGPFGFSDELYKRANETIALSKMTFSHQMVRLIFLEQLYRAMTIMKNEQYHH